MSRFYSHINTVRKILDGYDRTSPFSLYIKSFFAADKKYGSRDRKLISHYAYIFFRTGFLFRDQDFFEKMTKGIFLCHEKPIDGLPDDFNMHIGAPLSEKLVRVGASVLDIFPFGKYLSDKIDREAFALSMLIQPLLFIRLRPGRESLVKGKLGQAEISFYNESNDCISLENTIDLSKWIELDKDAVVQDFNSQKVFDFLQSYDLPKQKPTAWDCCAGSGGKSILFYDRTAGRYAISVTDVRSGILGNLRKRIAAAGLRLFSISEADLELSAPMKDTFSVIICDVPCTGSGTWSRTPEQFCYFNPNKIDEYAARQRKIIDNSICSLESGGLFFYITCSVFSLENEGAVKYILDHHPVEMLQQEYLTGYDKKADTMFVAVFREKTMD